MENISWRGMMHACSACISISATAQNERYQFRTWPDADVFIYVGDVNDNKPQWVIPHYPQSEDGGLTHKKYFAAIPMDTDVGRQVLTIHVSLICT